jgi:predicted peroxiredoxin
MSSENAKSSYMFSITHFDNDPDRTAIPLVLANSALSMGADVLVWLTLDAVKLASKAGVDGLQPKSFPAIADLLQTFNANGGRFGVCPPCAKTHGISDSDLSSNAEWMGAAAMLAESQQRQSAWF